MPFTEKYVRADIDGAAAGLVEPLVYQGKTDRFTVPAGFVTDFASVPQFVTWLVPKMGTYTRAAILHDWLCTQLEQAKRTRRHYYRREGRRLVQLTFGPRDVDGIFRRVMREAGVPLVRRWLMWTAVRWGALFNPARRAGWIRTAPAVVGISLLALPVIAPATVLVLAVLAVDRAAECVQ